MTDINLGLSEVANIVLSLLLIFQWYRDRAREGSIKNGLFAVRKMVSRIENPTSQNALDALDASLATLGARRPYTERCRTMLAAILDKFRRLEDAPLPEISPLEVAQLAEQ